MGQISIQLLIRDIAEAMEWKEGTHRDRRYVMYRLNRLQTELNKLDKINAKFKLEDLSTPARLLQFELSKTGISVRTIRSNLEGVWSTRDVGANLELNQAIHEKMNKIFENVGDIIRDLEKYEKDYNAASEIKLKFPVKWERRPD
jgi:hypothetical protein